MKKEYFFSGRAAIAVFIMMISLHLKAQDCPTFNLAYDAVGVSQYESVYYQIGYDPVYENGIPSPFTKMGWDLTYTDNNTWYVNYTQVPVHYLDAKCCVTEIGSYGDQTPDSFFTYDYPYCGYAEYTVSLYHPGCPTQYMFVGVYISE